jgi:putative endonuclease
MVFVYVLESEMDGARYTGMAEDVDNRIKEHNSGGNRYTKGHLPWKRIYCSEAFPSWVEARKHEKYLKSAAGRKWLEKFHGGNTGSLPA